ncbi:hypothetical protein QSH57_005025 [Fusarium oxysporum f. sp. vasinfectum]|nr:hypothetical protein QSH57_005025 [Fusarium oxysporum f. sp. vasinfectum]
MRLVRRTSRGPTERLRRETIPTSRLDDGIIGWDDQNDTAMPRNFSNSKKWFTAALLSAISMVTPFASSISSPAMSAINEEFGNTSKIIATLSVTIYLLGYAISPLFLAPLCESYGRKLILSTANAFFCICQIGCALAPNITVLIVFRFLAGMGGSGCLTLGAAVISDMFATDERGTAMGIFISGPLLGPLVGGFVVVRLDWRWEFWIILIVGGVLTVLYQLFSVETNPQVLIRRKVQYLKKSMGRDDLRSCYDDPQHVQDSPLQALIRGLVRPMKLLLLSPLVLPLSIYVAFAYGV